MAVQAPLPVKQFTVQPGNLRNLQIAETTLEPPGPGMVRITIKAIGLNFADIFAIWGLYKAAPKAGFTPGLEYAGFVESVGPGVSEFSPGDRIMGVTRFGAYATALNIDVRYLVKLPPEWSFETGAAYLVQTLTAYYGLMELGNLKSGQTVLIHSAVGGVGLQALKIAKQSGSYTIGTIGTPSKTAFGLAEGYDKMIVRGPDFEAQLRAALGDRPLDLVMDSVGGRYFTIPYRLLTAQGRVVVYGSARYASAGNRPNYLRMLYYFFTRPKIDPQSMPEYNKGVLGFNLIYLFDRAHVMHRILQELDAMQLKPPHVGHAFPFEQMKDAIALFQTGKTTGKVVVTVD
jgi:alcohol dehydrogenase